MFILMGLAPIGLRTATRFKVVAPRMFGNGSDQLGNVPLKRGKAKIETTVYPDTRDKHDFYVTFAEQLSSGQLPTALCKEPIRKEWGRLLPDVIPIAIRGLFPK